MPPDAWPRYLEAEYHDHLPEMHEDDARYTELLGLFANFSPELLSVIDTEGVWASGGYLGAWDADRRLAEMDREGIAAELVFQGDPRAISPLSPQFRKYPQDVAAAGVRAYHRWAADAFGEARDRILIVGDPASAVDIDAMLAELQWIADHGFAGAYVPGYWARPDLPAAYDPYFDPVLVAMCRARAARRDPRRLRPEAVRVPVEHRGPPARDGGRRAGPTCWPRSSTTPRASSRRTCDRAGRCGSSCSAASSTVTPQLRLADDRGAGRLAAGRPSNISTPRTNRCATTCPPSASRASTGRSTA